MTRAPAMPPPSAEAGAKAPGKGPDKGEAPVAVLHRQGDTWSLLAASTRNGLAVVEASRISSGQVPDAIRRLAKSHGVRRVLRIAPGAGTLARVFGVPRSDSRAAALGAAALQGEVLLPDELPPWRRAAGLISGAMVVNGQAGECGLVVGWIGAPQGEPSIEVEGVQERWTTPIASLAGLASRCGPGLLAYADRHDGSVGTLNVAAEGASTSARVVVEDNGSDASWAESLAARLGPSAPGSPGDVWLTPEAREAWAVRISGATVDDTWWRWYGLCIGALALAGGEEDLSGLCQLSEREPKADEPAIARAAAWLGTPRNAWWILGAAAALLVLVPFGVAWARFAILDARASGLAKEKLRRVELDQRAAIYKQLERDRRPMTKLLADVAVATPPGVTATNIRLTAEAGQGFSFQGVAKSREEVINLQASLGNTKLFRDLKINRTESKPDGSVEFDLTAEIADPHAKVTPGPDADWSKVPLAVRLHGEGASNTAPPAGIERPKSDRPKRAPRDDEDKAEKTERPKRDANELPKELSDDEINKMDRPTAMREMVARRTYPQKNPSLDKATKSRLESEVEKLRARMEATKGGAK